MTQKAHLLVFIYFTIFTATATVFKPTSDFLWSHPISSLSIRLSEELSVKMPPCVQTSTSSSREASSEKEEGDSSPAQHNSIQRGLIVKVFRIKLVHTRKSDDETDADGEGDAQQSDDSTQQSATPMAEMDGSSDRTRSGPRNQPSTLASKSQTGEKISSISTRYLRASRNKKYNHEYLIVKYSDLENEEPAKAKRVLEYFHCMGSIRYVHLCGLFLTGKCNYMSNNSFNTIEHMRRNHRKDKKLSAIKVVQYPGK